MAAAVFGGLDGFEQTQDRRAIVGGNSGFGKQVGGSGGCQAVGDFVARVGDEADEGRADVSECVASLRFSERLASGGQSAIRGATGLLTAFPGGIGRLTAIDGQRGEEASRDAPHTRDRLALSDEVDAFVAQFGRVGDVLKDALCSCLDVVGRSGW